jgi:hypothetical protein
MHKGIYKLLLAFVALFINALAFAQDTTTTVKTVVTTATGEEDMMRSNNKIFVVMAVCLTILVALILYVIRIDRKITRLENQQ